MSGNLVKRQRAVLSIFWVIDVILCIWFIAVFKLVFTLVEICLAL